MARSRRDCARSGLGVEQLDQVLGDERRRLGLAGGEGGGTHARELAVVLQPRGDGIRDDLRLRRESSEALVHHEGHVARLLAGQVAAEHRGQPTDRGLRDGAWPRLARVRARARVGVIGVRVRVRAKVGVIGVRVRARARVGVIGVRVRVRVRVRR